MDRRKRVLEEPVYGRDEDPFALATDGSGFAFAEVEAVGRVFDAAFSGLVTSGVALEAVLLVDFVAAVTRVAATGIVPLALAIDEAGADADFTVLGAAVLFLFSLLRGCLGVAEAAAGATDGGAPFFETVTGRVPFEGVVVAVALLDLTADSGPFDTWEA